MTSVVADMCWVTSHGTMWVQLIIAGLMEGRIKLGYLLWAPSGFTRTLGWCIEVTRVANKSEARLPGFESWLIHSLAVLP